MADQSFPKHHDENKLRNYGICHRPRLLNHSPVFGNAGQSSKNQGHVGQGHNNNQGHWNDFPSQNEAANDFAPCQDFCRHEEILSKDVESNIEALTTNLEESRDPKPDGDLFFNCLGFLSFGDPHPGIPDWTLGGDGFSLEGPPFVGPSADDAEKQREDCLDCSMTSYADIRRKDTGQPFTTSSSNNSIPDPVDQGTDIQSNNDLLRFVASETDYQDRDDGENPDNPEKEENEEDEEKEEEDMAAQEEPVEEFYTKRKTASNDEDWKRRQQEDRRNIPRQTTDKSNSAKQTTTTTTKRERERERIATKSPTRWRPILPKPNPIVIIEQRQQVTASAEDVMAAELRHKRRFWRCCSESFCDYNLYKIHIERHGIVEKATLLEAEEQQKQQQKEKKKKRERTTTSPTGRTKNYRALAGLDRAGLLDGAVVCLYCGSDSHADVTRTPGYSADDRACPQCTKPYKTLYCLRRHYCVKHSRMQSAVGDDSSGKPGSTPTRGPSDETESSVDDDDDDGCESSAVRDQPTSSRSRSSSPRSAEPRNESTPLLSSLFSSTD